MKNEQTEDKQSAWILRNLIAVLITTLVVGVTVYIAIFTLYHPSVGSDGKVDMSFIGQTLFPVWGTWMGTVLAFYFGKANFDAASKSYQDVIKTLTPDDKIAKLLVKDTMLPISKIEYLDYDKEKLVSINDILKYPQFLDYNRYAVLDQNKTVKYMIHRSVFLEFIYKQGLSPQNGDSSVATDVLTLDSLLSTTDERIKNTLTRGFGFVSNDATLLDAKKVIDSIDECQDVFITLNGKSTNPVIGLITNNMIFDKARV